MHRAWAALLALGGLPGWWFGVPWTELSALVGSTISAARAVTLQLVGDSDFCPRYHNISEAGLYDFSGPLLTDDGTWHVWEGKGAWSHYTSTDLLRWTKGTDTNFTYLTGSVSPTSTGVYAFYPTITQSSIAIAVAEDEELTRWRTLAARIDAPASAIGKNRFRDPTRALRLPGGRGGSPAWFVGVACGKQVTNRTAADDARFSRRAGALANGGDLWEPRSVTIAEAEVACGEDVRCCGFTHEGQSATEAVQVYFKQSCVLTTDAAWSVYLTQTSAPKGQICLYESENDSFSSFEDAGALVTVTDTMGHFDLRSFEWHADHFNVDIMECPDVFPLGNKFVILASLQGSWTSEWWSGRITGRPPRFQVERRGLLDYGQMYAAKTGTTMVQSGGSRRVLFAFGGWNEPTHIQACGRSMLLPRELSLANDGRLLQRPVSELLQLRIPGSKRRASHPSQPLSAGSTLEVLMNCTYSREGGDRGTIAIRVLETPSGLEYTDVGMDLTNRRYFVESTRLEKDTVLQTAPMPPLHGDQRDGAALTLRVFVDGEIIESFFQGGEVVLTTLNGPTPASGGPSQRRTRLAPAQAPGVECFAESWAMLALRE